MKMALRCGTAWVIAAVLVIVGSHEARAALPTPLYHVTTAEKIVALTFDDGPKPEYSMPVLKLLDVYDVRATFFVVGSEAKKHPDLIHRMAAHGHEIENHTFSHSRLDTMEQSRVWYEMEATSAIVKGVTGFSPKYFRPPGGRYNRVVLENLSVAGLAPVHWSINTGDFVAFSEELNDFYKMSTSASIEQKVLSRVKPGDIILFHFGGNDTAEALRTIIESLRYRGYRFLTVSELLAARGR